MNTMRLRLGVGRRMSVVCWRLLILLGMLLLSLTAVASTALTTAINQQIQKSLPRERIGVIVSSLGSKKILYQHDAAYRFTPASLMKLYPAITSLIVLGPDYRYNTWMLTNANTIKNHVLYGNVAIKFNYNPSFTTDDIEGLMLALKSEGINQIKGHVYLLKPPSFVSPYPPGRVWDDLSYAYAAPISEAILNQNKWRLKLLPKRLGHHAQLVVTPDLGVVHLLNHTVSTQRYSSKCPIRIYAAGGNHYYVSGCVPKKGVLQFRNLAYGDPLLFAKAVVRRSLKELGIRYQGTVQLKQGLYYHNYLFYESSPPLYKLVAYMLQHSNNVYADTLIATLAHYQQETTANGTSYWLQGLADMRHVLSQDIGINTKQLLITDGSGLSRYDLITPQSINTILQFAYHQKKLRAMWLNSLAKPGRPGTLRWRRKLKAYHVMAKTGSMSGVDGLAGYIENKDHQRRAFTIIVNGFVGNRQKVHQLERSICQMIYQKS